MSDNELPQSGEPPRRGHGLPPPEHQFEKGRRGPGRPRGSRNKPKGLTVVESLLYEDAFRLLPLASASGQPANKDERARIPIIQGVCRAQAHTALKGGSKAQKDYTDRTERLANKVKETVDADLAFWESYVRYWETLKGIHPPERLVDYEKILLPHPDDVEVDFRARKIWIRGPATTLEKRMWNGMLAVLSETRSKVLEMREVAHLHKSDRKFQFDLLIFTMRFVDNNEKLPARHQLPPLPIWDRGDIPLFLHIGPPVDWSGVEDEPEFSFD